jgi:serine/threonine protein kinase
LGDYELLEEIGSGGMGFVYKARQTSLGRVVAVKVIQPALSAREAFVVRFQQEATLASRLRHPNIVSIHEFGECDGRHFFSMDYVEGGTLGDLVREHPLSAERAARLVKTVAEAVHYAHQHGILHRDLKPSNVLVDGSGQPHITDFGLAKAVDEKSGLTLSGQLLGSPPYMPPEQASGKVHTISVRSDVYSLGAILYDLLCRRPPFLAETSVETLRQVVETEPAPLRLLNPKVPRDLETICLKCIEKDPQRRYCSAQELAEDLGRFLAQEPIRARRVTPPEKAWRWCKRKPALASSLAAILLLSGGSASIFSIQQQRAAAQTRRAEAALSEQKAREAEARDQAQLGQLLSRIQVMRTSPRKDGWSQDHWMLATQAALIRTNSTVKNHAAAGLVGIDARVCLEITNVEGRSLAFDASGERLLVGGAGTNRTLLWDFRNNQLRDYPPVRAEWVGFRSDDTPLVFYRKETYLAALADPIRGKELQYFALPRPCDPKPGNHTQRPPLS